MYPGSVVTVDLDAQSLLEGDVAGLCLLQSDYGYVGIKKVADDYVLVQEKRPSEAEGKMNPQTDTTKPLTVASQLLARPCVTLRARVEFTEMKDIAHFEVCIDGKWQSFGEPMKLYFKLDHFCGVRAGLFCYATTHCGGSAKFTNFNHELM